MMNGSAMIHESTLRFRQPLARNKIRFRLLTGQGDCASAVLCCRKRDEAAQVPPRRIPMHVRCADGQREEWICEAEFPEEVHYLKYCFFVTGTDGETRYFSERGSSAALPQTGLFELLQANETDVLTLPEWSRGLVYYQIFPERFAIGNGEKQRHAYVPWDAKPDRVEYFGGDLAGILHKLPYLQELGAECLYLTPVFTGEYNHKYATIDYFTVDPDFGTNADLIALVKAAHAAGIRVLLDGVFNHVGVRFAPFADVMDKGEASPYRDWFYIKRFPVTEDAACYECVGDFAGMPRLRTSNPEVREYILSVMLFWLETAGIDGWRLDVADELDTAALRFLREQVKRQYPDSLLLGETWGDASRMPQRGRSAGLRDELPVPGRGRGFFRRRKHRRARVWAKARPYADEVCGRTQSVHV